MKETIYILEFYKLCNIIHSHTYLAPTYIPHIHQEN